MAALGGDSKRKLFPLTPSIYYISLKKTDGQFPRKE
jgi:hypothetical protein